MKAYSLSIMALAAAGSLQAASLITAFDFAGLPANVAAPSSVSSNYSEVAASATLYWDGQYGSSTLNAPFPLVGGSYSGLTSSSSVVTDSSPLGYTFATNNQRIQFANAGFASAQGATVIMEVNVGSAVTLDQLTYAYGMANGGSGTIQWSAGDSYDALTDVGSAFTSSGSDVAGTTIDLSSLGTINDGVFYIGITFDSIAINDQLLLDNIAITGSLVPEPSTYAVIFGGLVLGFIAVRRRRR